jgi:hypothetical protein
MSVKIIRDVLLAVIGDQVGHWTADKAWRDKYAVYGETSAPTVLSADDRTEQIMVSGEIFYYTTEEFDEAVDRLCIALQEAEVSCSVDAIGYDQELRQTSYQIHWEVCCGKGEIYR